LADTTWSTGSEEALATAAPGKGEPHRRLGFGTAVALTVGNIVGVGIFLTPSAVAAASPDGAVYLGLWLLGVAIALAGALATAELGSLFPRAGGDYVFLGEAFGSPIAYAWGWLSVAATFSGSIAALAVGAMDTLATMSWAAPLAAARLDLGLVTLPWQKAGAVAIVWAVTFAHVRSVRLVSGVQLALTWAPVLVFLVVSAWVLATDPAPLAAAPAAGGGGGGTGGGAGGPDGFDAGLVSAAFCAVFFTYSGWNVLTYVGGEVKTPGRTIPVAILAALLTTAVVYLLLNAAFLQVLPLETLRTAPNAGVAAAERLFGPVGGDAFAALLTCSIIAGLNVTAMAGSRIALAMARSGYLWRSLAETNPDHGTPRNALLLQGAWATVLVLTGGFLALVTFTGAVMILLSCVTVATLFVFRRRGVRGAWRAVGYPWTPVFFIVVGVGVLLLGVTSQWVHLLVGVGAFGLLALRDWWRGRARRPTR
jgi:APA family basic amino acid/polyamine antiporter